MRKLTHVDLASRSITIIQTMTPHLIWWMSIVLTRWTTATSPNIVFILVDDQVMDTMHCTLIYSDSFSYDFPPLSVDHRTWLSVDSIKCPKRNDFCPIRDSLSETHSHRLRFAVYLDPRFSADDILTITKWRAMTSTGTARVFNGKPTWNRIVLRPLSRQPDTRHFMRGNISIIMERWNVGDSNTFHRDGLNGED